METTNSELASISVIIPAFNSANYIGDAINSALKQTFVPDELIIVDDGSTDDTKEIVSSYNGKVKYFYQNNAGPGKARNTGIRKAQGDLIAFLDSDDRWQPNHLQLLEKRLRQNPKAAMVYGRQRLVNESGVPLNDQEDDYNLPEGRIFSELFSANYIPTPAVLVSRKILVELGGFKEDKVFKNAEDYDLWLRISSRAVVLAEPSVVFDYRRHDNNLTLNKINRSKGMLAALNSAVDLINTNVVDPQNSPSKIDIEERMSRIYKSSVILQFNIGNYHDVKDISKEALGKGYISFDLLVRFTLCHFPTQLLIALKRLKKLLKK